VPDATGLELIAQELGDNVIETSYFRDKAALLVKPESIRDVLETLRGKGFTFMASVHGVDYFPEEPRLGVQYELLDMKEVDRITVKLRVPLDAPNVPSVTPATRSARSTTCSA
jgi:NADH-quinone oxidoreductase subunit C